MMLNEIYPKPKLSGYDVKVLVKGEEDTQYQETRTFKTFAEVLTFLKEEEEKGENLGHYEISRTMETGMLHLFRR